MKRIVLTLLMLISIAGCEDRYRYACQNPDNFAKAECQKPRCLFTQTCPEYLVAPVLENKVANQPTSSASSDR
jgi:hypothetical protein